MEPFLEDWWEGAAPDVAARCLAPTPPRLVYGPGIASSLWEVFWVREQLEQARARWRR